MSETEHWIGTLFPIKIPKQVDPDWESQINYLQSIGYWFTELDLVKGWYDESNVILIDNIWYNLERKRYEDSVCKAIKQEDGQISFVLNFYNGGASFEEALEQAVEKMKNE